MQQQVLGVAARAVPVFLATLAVPGGAFLQLARGLYNGVMTFVEKGRQIAQVGSALLGSVSAIAAGQLAPAAQAVEATLVKVLPVALSFLAKWLGLDGISGAIQTGLKKVQVPVEKAVTKVLDTVVDKAQVLWGAVKGGAGKVVDQGKAVATAVVGKVAGWLNFRQEFTLPNHEKHILFFREDGQLMMASTPQPYTAYLDKLTAHAAVASSDLQVKYAAAYKLADDIADWEKVNGAQATLPVAIQQKLATLAHLTLELMQLDPAMGAPSQIAADTKPAYAGLLAEAGFGRGMHVHYLSYSTVRGGLSAPSGSSPYGHGVNDTFDALNQRRWNASTANYYARGHLLSEKLNGPGKALENIIPLSRTGNRLHEEQVESTLKKAAGHDTATRAFAYSVVPRYGRPLDRTLQAHALGLGTAAGRIWARIIEAEQYVPLNLVCTFTEIDAHTRQPVATGLSLHQIVDNPVDQAATAYVNNAVTTAAATAYNFGGKHPAVDINNLNRATDLTDIGFSAADAQDVVNHGKRFADKKSVYAFKQTADWQASVKRGFDKGELKVG